MADSRFEQIKPFIILGAFLLGWWLVPTVVKSFLRVSFTEFHAPVWVTASYLDDLGDFWARRNHSNLELIEAGQAIARRKAFYQLQVQRNTLLEGEVERLERFLNLPPRETHDYEVARVIRRDINAWWQSITIRKGRDFNIPNGAAVVFEGGVVGRVVEVNAYTSRIELISSPNFRMAASFEGEARPVVYQGAQQTAFSTPVGQIRDAPQDLIASGQRPLRLVSTDLGGVFPAGLHIGLIEWLEPGSSGLFQDGEVILDSRLLDLREVTVLIPREDDAREASREAGS